MLETGKRIAARKPRLVPWLIAALVAVALGGVVYLLIQQGSGSTTTQVVLTDEARGYLPNLDLEEVQMAATDNTLGFTLVEITGKIRNNGDRPIQSIRLNCVFFDVYGIELHRVLSMIVRSGDGLVPGAARDFRLPFDDIPEGWNQVMPNLYIAEIVFD